MSSATWVASRFNLSTCDADGAMLLYNSYMGAFARISESEAPRVRSALEGGVTETPTGILADLCVNGFLVPDGVDESKRADALRAEEYAARHELELVLLPNEQCNFRCRYCSQTFARKKMKREVIEGIVAHVRSRAPSLSVLTVGWFGGEPLTAIEIIEEVAGRLKAICGEYGIYYSSSMATNGYLLTPRVAEILFKADVRGFQITLDGPQEQHDRLRVLADGKTGTFEMILANLKALRDQPESFKAVIRVNFDALSVECMDTFLDLVRSEFGPDPRFCLDFHPVGKWGGPYDEYLAVCGIDDGRTYSVELARKAAEGGFEPYSLREQLKPLGSKCYAARPHSFVIGSDGTVYKCTVALEDPRNHVGRITGDGELLIDAGKHAQWIGSGDNEDAGCRSCFFRPSCQGNACPLHRMNTRERPCPTIKTNIEQVLYTISVSHVVKSTGRSAGPIKERDHITVNS